MNKATLAASAAAVLAPLLAKGAEKFAQEFGKEAYQKSKALLERLRARLKGKPESQKALVACEQAPGRESQAALTQAIEAEMSADPDLARALAPLIEELTALVRAAGAASPKYQVASKIVGALGDGAQATFHLDRDALED